MPNWKITVLSFVALSTFTFYEVNPISILALTPGTAIGGLVTGVIGLALGSMSLAIVLGKVELVDEPTEAPGYEYEYDQYRKRRSTDYDKQGLQMEKLQVEQFMDTVYKEDSSRCIEKLVCNITKRGTEGSMISQDEEDILNIIEQNSNHGFTFKKMLMAQKVAVGGGDCEFLFDSCSLNTSQMVQFIHETARNVTKAQSSL